MVHRHVGNRIARHAPVSAFEHRLLTALLVNLHDAAFRAHVQEALVMDDFRHEVLARNVLPVRQLGLRRDGDKEEERVNDNFLHIFTFFYYSLLLITIYEQYLLSRLDKGISPFWYRSASSFRILSHIVFLPLYNALRYGMPFSSVMLTSVKNCVKSSAS